MIFVLGVQEGTMVGPFEFCDPENTDVITDLLIKKVEFTKSLIIIITLDRPTPL